MCCGLKHRMEALSKWGGGARALSPSLSLQVHGLLETGHHCALEACVSVKRDLLIWQKRPIDTLAYLRQEIIVRLKPGTCIKTIQEKKKNVFASVCACWRACTIL